MTLWAAHWEAWTVPTFECLSVYYHSAVGDAGKCAVRYRAADGTEWREGLPLTYDERDQQYRGSLGGRTPQEYKDLADHESQYPVLLPGIDSG